MFSVPAIQRKHLAAVLSLLWGLYTLLGALGACLSAGDRSASSPMPAPRTAAQAPAPICHCVMCRGMIKGGRMKCCCGKADLPPAQRAVMYARCDQGAAAILATATSWPVTIPDGAVAAALPLNGMPSRRPWHHSVPSAVLLPPTPPPCLQ